MLQKHNRPFFLICHSTGGLVAKYALILAAQGTQEDKLVAADCFGISFFGILGGSLLHDNR